MITVSFVFSSNSFKKINNQHSIAPQNQTHPEMHHLSPPPKTRSRRRKSREMEETNNTFNLSDVCIVLAFTAHIFDPGGDVVETLSTIFRVPLGRRSIVQPQMLVRATAPPMRQTLLRWKSRERRDRARFTPVIRCTVAVTLVGRVLEGVFLARRPARFGERSTGRRAATGPNLSHALPHRDLLELHHLRAV